MTKHKPRRQKEKSKGGINQRDICHETPKAHFKSFHVSYWFYFYHNFLIINA